MQVQICPPCPNVDGLVVWLPIIVNAILAVIVCWYTLETRWLRKQSQAQLDLLKQQGIKSLAPFILPSVVNSATKLREFKKDHPIIQDDFAEEEVRRQLGQGVKYSGSIENLTDNLALNVRLYVFESESRTFLKGSQACPFLQRDTSQPRHMRIDEVQKSIEFIPKPSGVKIDIKDKPFSSDLLKGEFESDYAPNDKWLMGEIMSDTRTSFILAIYTDVEGNPYIIRRRFAVDEKDLITHGPAVRVAPTFSLPSSRDFQKISRGTRHTAFH
jgi:hypothetical protein